MIPHLVSNTNKLQRFHSFLGPYINSCDGKQGVRIRIPTVAARPRREPVAGRTHSYLLYSFERKNEGADVRVSVTTERSSMHRCRATAEKAVIGHRSSPCAISGRKAMRTYSHSHRGGVAADGARGRAYAFVFTLLL